MRHRKKFNHLSRKTGDRKALLKGLSISLVEHKRIQTTLAKAKALRQHIEPILTKSKEDTLQNRREVFSVFQNKEAVKEIFGTIAPKIADRPGGYTRIVKLGYRLGDSAQKAMIELVDFNELYDLKNDVSAKKKTRRSRRKTEVDAAEKSEGGTVNAKEVVAVPETKSEDSTNG